MIDTYKLEITRDGEDISVSTQRQGFTEIEIIGLLQIKINQYCKSAVKQKELLDEHNAK